MTRIVCSQKGTERARVKVVSRQINVRYKPSKAFVEKVKKARKSKENHAEDEGLESPERPERKAASSTLETGGRLPRLSAYFDRVSDVPEAPAPSSHVEPSNAVGDLNAIRDRIRRPEPARRSAYEELRARWRQK